MHPPQIFRPTPILYHVWLDTDLLGMTKHVSYSMSRLKVIISLLLIIILLSIYGNRLSDFNVGKAVFQ